MSDYRTDPRRHPGLDPSNPRAKLPPRDTPRQSNAAYYVIGAAVLAIIAWLAYSGYDGPNAARPLPDAVSAPATDTAPQPDAALDAVPAPVSPEAADPAPATNPDTAPAPPPAPVN